MMIESRRESAGNGKDTAQCAGRPALPGEGSRSAPGCYDDRMSNITTPWGERAPPAAAAVPDRRAAEWGLGSVLLGALLILTTPLILIVNILMAAFGPSALGMNANAIQLATAGFVTVLVLLLALGVTGLVFGGISISAARSHHQSIAVGLAGLLVCAVGLLGLVVVGIDTGFVLEWFNRSPNR